MNPRKSVIRIPDFNMWLEGKIRIINAVKKNYWKNLDLKFPKFGSLNSWKPVIYITENKISQDWFVKNSETRVWKLKTFR